MLAIKMIIEYLSKLLLEFMANPNDSKISNDLKPAVI